MKLRIRPVNHKGNRYCGPSAISAVTGMTTDDAARLIRHVGGRTSVKGTFHHEIHKAMALCGIRLLEQPTVIYKARLGLKVNQPMTLTQWYKASVKERNADTVFLIVAGQHYQLVQGRRFVCGQTRDIVPITSKKTGRRRRVSRVWRLEAPRGVEVPMAAKAPKRVIDSSQAKLKALLKKLGTTGRVRKEGGYTDYIVEPCEAFPRGLGTVHYDWGETLERIEAVLEGAEIEDDGEDRGRTIDWFSC